MQSSARYRRDLRFAKPHFIPQDSPIVAEVGHAHNTVVQEPDACNLVRTKDATIHQRFKTQRHTAEPRTLYRAMWGSTTTGDSP